MRPTPPAKIAASHVRFAEEQFSFPPSGRARHASTSGTINPWEREEGPLRTLAAFGPRVWAAKQPWCPTCWGLRAQVGAKLFACARPTTCGNTARSEPGKPLSWRPPPAAGDKCRELTAMDNRCHARGLNGGRGRQSPHGDSRATFRQGGERGRAIQGVSNWLLCLPSSMAVRQTFEAELLWARSVSLISGVRYKGRHLSRLEWHGGEPQSYMICVQRPPVGVLVFPVSTSRAS